MINCPIRDCGQPTDLPSICATHRGYLTASLAELPSYYVRLHAVMADSGSADVKVAGTRNPPMPISATARALQEDMLAITETAESYYRRVQGFTALPQRGREGRRIVGSSAFCVTHLDGILLLSWATDFARDVFRCTSSTRYVLGLDRLVHTLPAPCPSCEMLALQRSDGASHVVCAYCGRRFDEDDYQRLVLILASGL